MFTLVGPNYKDIDIGQSAKPQIIDVNRDGLPDLLIGERSGTLNYFENTGTPENADFNSEPTSDLFGMIDVMPECCTGYSAPFMAEDSTGNYILYVGSEQGMLYLFNDIDDNLEGAFNLVDSIYLNRINVSVSGSDINSDGELEMVSGCYEGGIGLLKYGIPPGLGITDRQRSLLNVEAYPNPAKGYVHITVNELRNRPVEMVFVEVLNPMGRLLDRMQFPAASGKITLQTEKYAPGLYFIRLKTDAGAASLKLFIR